MSGRQFEYSPVPTTEILCPDRTTFDLAGTATDVTAAIAVRHSTGCDTVQAHLTALDHVYTEVIEGTRKGIEGLEELDPVTQDLLIDHAAELEKFHWLVRAHLENARGRSRTDGPEIA